jgi:hypothetical protein
MTELGQANAVFEFHNFHTFVEAFSFEVDHVIPPVESSE